MDVVITMETKNNIEFYVMDEDWARVVLEKQQTEQIYLFNARIPGVRYKNKDWGEPLIRLCVGTSTHCRAKFSISQELEIVPITKEKSK